MTIADVLEMANWPTGRGRRTRCPIHRGDNASAFSYTEELWHCHVCGESGNVFLLRKALGVLPPPPPPRPARTVVGVITPRAAVRPANRPAYTETPTKPTERLKFALSAKWRHLREEAMVLHDLGWQAQVNARRVLAGGEASNCIGLARRLVGRPEDREERWNMAADLWVAGQRMIDMAHAVLDCDCNEGCGGGKQTVVRTNGGDLHEGDGGSVRNDGGDLDAVFVLPTAAGAPRQN